MNKQQYFRLTGVLVILFIILSWWLSTQEFILEQRVVIECNWEENACQNVYAVHEDDLHQERARGLHLDLSSTFREDSLLLITHFNAPIEAKYFDKGDWVPNPIISAITLEHYACEIMGANNNYSYLCLNDNIPSDFSHGYFNFTNDEYDKKFTELVALAKERVGSYNYYYLFTAVVIFISLLVFYLLFSYLLKFIIYGFRKK